MSAYLDGMQRYVDFNGRATRAQFWQFVLAVAVLLLLAAFLDGVFDLRVGLSESVLGLAVGVAHFVPFVAISVRRLHDTDRSGWWYLVNAIPLGSIIFLVLVCIPSTPDTNNYGPPVDSDAPGASLNRNAQNSTARSFFAPLLDGHWQQYTPPSHTGAPVPPGTAQSLDEATLIERLERLAGLRASGVIDDAEFQSLKAKLLPSTQS